LVEVISQASAEDSTLIVPLPLLPDGSLDSVRLHAEVAVSAATAQAAVISLFTSGGPFDQLVWAGWGGDATEERLRGVRIR